MAGHEPSAPSTLRDFRAILARVTDWLDRGDSTFSATAPLAAFIQQRIGCSSVSFWSLLYENRQAVMSRIGGHDGTLDAPITEPMVRPASEFDLKALADAAIAIVPAPAEPATAGDALPSDDSFFPARIDVAIAANGETFGIIRCEFDDPPRAWKLAETTLLRSFAGEIALRRARRRARRN